MPLFVIFTSPLYTLFMTQKTLRDIVKEDDKLRLFNLIKHNKYDKNTWEFQIIDERSPYSGVVDYLTNYRYQITTMRYNNHFFLVYKIYMTEGEEPEYLVDIKKANHRNSIEKFVNSVAEYSVYSNDVSVVKNASSFKVSQREMKYLKIDNFLDLCYKFGNFSAIGTGITRDIRNLIVLDIDVNCDTDSNKAEINRILLEFAKCNSLPDFIIKNHESHHIQMQWLVKDVIYKTIDQEIIKNHIDALKTDNNKRKELNFFGINFMELTEWGVDYRKFSTALTCISKKHKFGDKNYKYWKAKNYESARLGLYNLELLMPYYRDGEIKYLSKEEIDSLLETKDARRDYFDEAPTIVELYQKTKHLIVEHIEKIDDKKIKKIKDEDIEIEENIRKNKILLSKEDIENGNFGKSRNTFVLNCTRTITWRQAREHKFRSSKDILSLSEKEQKQFKNEIHSIVKELFNKMDKKYNGKWPDTTNYGKYPKEEFENTFNNSYTYAISTINDFYYTDEQREQSLESRRLSKNVNICVVNDVKKKYKKIKREDLLKETNEILKQNGHKPISLGSLKRYLSELKNMNEDDKIELYNNIEYIKQERKKDLSDALESSEKDSKKVKMCIKRLKQVVIK
jgi:hypothetical protein